MLHATRTFPWYPSALAATFVTYEIVDTGVHPLSGGRALIAAVLGTIVIQVLLTLVTRRHHLAALVTFLVLAVAIEWLPLLDVAYALGALEPWKAGVLAGLLLILTAFGIRTCLYRRPSLRLANATQGLNVFTIALVVVTAISMMTSPMFGPAIGDLLPRRGGPATAPTGGAPPNIVVILVDGHPRADSFREQTGQDLNAFVSSLEQLGFAVAPDSHSNYDWTGASLATLLDMRPMGDDPGVRPADTGYATEQLRQTLNDNAAFDLLHRYGYEITAIGPPYEHVALRGADRFEDAGYLNGFECHLIRQTAVGMLAWAISPRIVEDPRRAAVERSLQIVSQLAKQGGNRPQFVFAHVPAPHLPILWDATGNPVDDPLGADCAPPTASGMELAQREATYVGYLRHVDQLVLESIATILQTAATPPVIVLLSDHGGHLGLDDRPDARWRDEFANLLATYTPDHPNLFPADETPVNLLPRLFNAYLKTDLALQPDDAYWANGERAAPSVTSAAP